MSENLTVAKDVVVGLAYTLYVENAVEDSAPASAPLEYIHGHGNLISGLEAALEGLKVGDKKNVTVEPEDAYGDYDPENVIDLDRSLFPAEFPIEKGRLVPLEDDEGNHLHSYILDWNDDTVTVDARAQKKRSKPVPSILTTAAAVMTAVPAGIIAIKGVRFQVSEAGLRPQF